MILQSKTPIEDCLSFMYRSLNIPLDHYLGCTYVKTGLKIPLLNGVVDCHLQAAEMQAAVTHVANYFKKMELPYSWWIEKSKEPQYLKAALQEEGLNFWGEVMGMNIDLSSYQPYSYSNHLEIEVVQSESALKEWGQVICKVFGMQDELAKSYFRLYQNNSASNTFIHLIGQKDGKAICSGSVVCQNANCYLYNIATLESERNKGYAAALTQELLQISKEKGASQGLLQSSPMVAPFYLKLGFQDVCRFNIYMN